MMFIFLFFTVLILVITVRRLGHKPVISTVAVDYCFNYRGSCVDEHADLSSTTVGKNRSD